MACEWLSSSHLLLKNDIMSALSLIRDNFGSQKAPGLTKKPFYDQKGGLQKSQVPPFCRGENMVKAKSVRSMWCAKCYDHLPCLLD